MAVGYFQGHNLNDSVGFGEPVVSPQIPDHGSGITVRTAPLTDNDANAPQIMGLENPEPKSLWIHGELYRI